MRTLLLIALVACGGSQADSSASTPSLPGTTPAVAAPAAAYDGMYQHDKLLDAKLLVSMSTTDMVRARNEVYARHGRAFNNDDLRAHFEAQAWYKVDSAYSDSMLTENDKKNADMIRSFEKSSGDPVKVGEFEGRPNVMFIDAKNATLLYGGAMYEHMHETVHWMPKGDWIVTWKGAESFDLSSVEEPFLWKLDHKTKTIKDVGAIPQPKG